MISVFANYIIIYNGKSTLILYSVQILSFLCTPILTVSELLVIRLFYMYEKYILVNIRIEFLYQDYGMYNIQATILLWSYRYLNFRVLKKTKRNSILTNNCYWVEIPLFFGLILSHHFYCRNQTMPLQGKSTSVAW